MGILGSASEDIKSISTGDEGDNGRGNPFALSAGTHLKWIFAGSYNRLLVERLSCNILALVFGYRFFSIGHGFPFTQFTYDAKGIGTVMMFTISNYQKFRNLCQGIRV